MGFASSLPLLARQLGPLSTFQFSTHKQLKAMNSWLAGPVLILFSKPFKWPLPLIFLSGLVTKCGGFPPQLPETRIFLERKPLGFLTPRVSLVFVLKPQGLALSTFYQVIEQPHR